jgi:hypothetical protein
VIEVAEVAEISPDTFEEATDNAAHQPVFADSVSGRLRPADVEEGVPVM